MSEARNLFIGTVHLRCSAKVNGEHIFAQQAVADVVWQDPVAREAVKDALRAQLMREIARKWKPKIEVIV